MKTSRLIIVLAVFSIFGMGFWLGSHQEELTKSDVFSAAKLIGLDFTVAEVDSMMDGLKGNLQAYEALRSQSIPNDLAPSLVFMPAGMTQDERTTINWELRPVEMPKNKEELAFFSVRELAWLIQNKKISSLELTNIYLDRLKKHGPTLECVVSITESLALEQAKKADAEIAAGNIRGPLHGIPYGVKDLLAVEGYKTTWGATPYKEQMINETATIVKKMEEAGAVLVAKLSLGALAWGDVWFDGVTKNPWNLSQGSSGSSAGSASATAAGLVAFSIGSETLGSIVSPSTRCGTTGLRPTFGAVSRHGAMALSWTMDKLGPITRNAGDAALVYEVIRGYDPKDPFSSGSKFPYRFNSDLKKMKIAYLANLFDGNYPNKKNDSLVLVSLKAAGVELIPVEWKIESSLSAMNTILSAEAAAAFDELTRSNQDDLLVRQVKNAWPNVFRTSRFIPAVEYINANRLRSKLIEEVENLLSPYDAVLSPSFAGGQLQATNLSGHPCLVFPNYIEENGNNSSVSVIGKFHSEAALLAVAEAYQNLSEWENMKPTRFAIEAKRKGKK